MKDKYNYKNREKYSRENYNPNAEDMSWKIWMIIYPALIYLGISMVIQVISTFASINGFFSRFTGAETITFADGLTFVDKMDKIVSENSVYITLVSAIITIPIMLFLMDRDVMKSKINKTYRKYTKPEPFFYFPLCALAVASCIGVSAMVTLIPLDNVLGSYGEVEKAVFSSNIIIQILATVIAAPIVEELIFRGLAYNRAKNYTDWLTAAVLSALAFGVYHFNLVQGMYTFIIGVILAYVYERYKTIIAPIVFHAVINLVTVLLNVTGIGDAIDSNIFIKIIVAFLGLFITYRFIKYFQQVKISTDITPAEYLDREKKSNNKKNKRKY